MERPESADGADGADVTAGGHAPFDELRATYPPYKEIP